MQTIQCPRCRHIFLSYAAECPECGLKRPRETRSKSLKRAALIASSIALTATVWMVKSLLGQPDESLVKRKTVEQAPLRTVAKTASR